MSRKLALLLSTWFYVGFFPVAPGTAGSIVAVLIAAFLHHYLGFAPWMFAVMAVLLFPIAVRASTITAKANNLDDPGFVVIDEVAGQWIALLGCPADWRHALMALILFRLFDITKPFPARQLERLPAGWGIVFDDVAAGLYAWGVAALLRLWI